MSDAVQMSEADKAALNQAFSGVVTPYSQVRETMNPEAGLFDLVMIGLQPGLDKNGLYTITVEVKITAPASYANGPQSKYTRTLYVGTKKDKLAQQPDTRLNSPGLRWLKLVGKVTDVPINDQTDAQLCAALLGKAFQSRIEETKYKDATGAEKTGSDFGRTPMKLGTMPAKLDKDAAVAAVAAVAANGTAAAASGFSE